MPWAPSVIDGFVVAVIARGEVALTGLSAPVAEAVQVRLDEGPIGKDAAADRLRSWWAERG